MTSAPSDEVQRLRREMDALDDQIRALLIERLRLSREIIALKARQGLSELDSERQREILNRLADTLSADEADLIQRIYGEIFRRPPK